MRDERRKEERNKQGQTNNKAKQHSSIACTCIYVSDCRHVFSRTVAVEHTKCGHVGRYMYNRHSAQQESGAAL